MSLELKLERDGHDQPWGFRLQGGSDVGLPLTVIRVLVGSPADNVLRRGDLLAKVGGQNTGPMTHQQAVDAFERPGNVLKLTVKRNGNNNNVSGSPAASIKAQVANIVQVAASATDTKQSPQVAALPRTVFVAKDSLPQELTNKDGADHLSLLQSQPYRTVGTDIQPSVKPVLPGALGSQGLGPGSSSHLRLQEDICTGVREPQLVPISSSQAKALQANETIMKLKVDIGCNGTPHTSILGQPPVAYPEGGPRGHSPPQTGNSGGQTIIWPPPFETQQIVLEVASDHQRSKNASPLLAAAAPAPAPPVAAPKPAPPPPHAEPPKLLKQTFSKKTTTHAGMVNPVNQPHKALFDTFFTRKYDPEASATWQAINELENCHLVSEHGPEESKLYSL